MERFGKLNELEKKILDGGEITGEEALDLANLGQREIYHLLSVSGRVTRHFRGLELEICSIINFMAGGCSEDCRFCTQSARHNTGAPVHPPLSPEEVLKQALFMEKAGAGKFSLVSSGRGISGQNLEKALRTIDLLKRKTSLELCASLGIIDIKTALRLKEAGLSTYHHNLETAPGHFPNICTTHSYGQRLETIIAARGAGLRVCAGGIIGLGETFAQRIEIALEIRRLGVDSIPLNFLTPIPGTPMESAIPPAPMSVLHTIAVFRLVLPRSVIRLCGGRTGGLRDLQALAFTAGADGVMIGDYLTTRGGILDRDLQMFSDLGLRY